MTTAAITTTTATSESMASGSASPPPPAAGNARPLWSIAGAVLAIASLGWGTLSVVNLLAHGEFTVEETYDADDVGALDVSNDNGTVTVIATPGDTVTATAEVSDGLRSTEVDQNLVDGVLKLRGDCPALNAIWCSVDYTVLVPPDRPVTIDASNGSVEVRGMTADLDLDTDNGGIDIEGSAGTIRVSNDNGRITGTALRSAVVEASNHNGASRCRSTSRPPRSRPATATGASRSSCPTMLSSRTASSSVPGTAAPTTASAPTRRATARSTCRPATAPSSPAPAPDGV